MRAGGRYVRECYLPVDPNIIKVEEEFSPMSLFGQPSRSGGMGSCGLRVLIRLSPEIGQDHVLLAALLPPSVHVSRRPFVSVPFVWFLTKSIGPHFGFC